MVKVLVTGGLGFLGRRLCDALEARGHKTFAFDSVAKQDILNYDQFYAALKESQATVCIHLAAVANLYIMRDNPEQSWKINIEGTENVMKACDALGVRCLFASTCCAYGNNNCHPSNEDSPLCPTEIYAESKKVGEGIVKKYGGEHCCMRLATFYGPTMRSALVQAVFLRLAFRGQKLKIHGTGKQTRTYTHVDDIVTGIVAILESEKRYFAVNVSQDQNWSVLDVAKYAMEAVGTEVPIEHVQDRPGQIYSEVIDNSRLRSMGWEPKWGLLEGMKDTLEALRADLEEELRSGKDEGESDPAVPKPPQPSPAGTATVPDPS